ncbi:MAG: FAD:protein FMN transferase [Kiloniellales bacterium]|nr:FAD:protein FMN transferase [Kiloniellales bacterium]
MRTKGPPSRRRFLRIAAAAAGLGLLGPSARASQVEFQTWRGTALGAQASIRLYHSDPKVARALIERARAEIERLEQIFSLYRADSAVSVLNRQGRIEAPPLDLVRILAEARRYSALTEGAFDVTVQPLWRVYAAYFWQGNGTAEGPDPAAIAAALERVDHRAVAVDPAFIAFEKPGMAITLNGIAQGYITDRIAELLRSAGLEDVLIDLGELRALGRHPDGRPWEVGLSDPRQRRRLLRRLALDDAALASSAGAGTRFDGEGRFHHLFDPRLGRSSNRYLGLSVRAPTATQADALSTGLFHLDWDRLAAVVRRSLGIEAFALLPDGEERHLPG